MKRSQANVAKISSEMFTGFGKLSTRMVVEIEREQYMHQSFHVQKKYCNEHVLSSVWNHCGRCATPHHRVFVVTAGMREAEELYRDEYGQCFD